MQTSEHGFEQIMSAVLEQKQVWEKLQAENRELRQQLIDLRAGRGIFVEVMNQRFQLVWDSSKAEAEAAEAANKRGQTPKIIKGVAQPAPASPGALEELLLDELSSAMSNRMNNASDRKANASLNEEQKASLRRELSGSFLLE